MQIFHFTVEDITGEESVEVAVRAVDRATAEDAAWSWARDKFDWIEFESTTFNGIVETISGGMAAISA